jgi:hypothetical protein
MPVDIYSRSGGINFLKNISRRKNGNAFFTEAILLYCRWMKSAIILLELPVPSPDTAQRLDGHTQIGRNVFECQSL